MFCKYALNAYIYHTFIEFHLPNAVVEIKLPQNARNFLEHP